MCTPYTRGRQHALVGLRAASAAPACSCFSCGGHGSSSKGAIPAQPYNPAYACLLGVCRAVGSSWCGGQGSRECPACLACTPASVHAQARPCFPSTLLTTRLASLAASQASTLGELQCHSGAAVAAALVVGTVALAASRPASGRSSTARACSWWSVGGEGPAPQGADAVVHPALKPCRPAAAAGLQP